MKKVTVFSLVLFLSVNFNAFAQETDGAREVQVNILFSEVFLQILATIFIILLIKKYAWKNFIEMLETRKQHINDSIIEATSSKENALALEGEKSKELEAIKNKTKSILEDSKKEAKVQEEQIVLDAKEKAKSILEKSNKEIESQKRELKSQLSKELAEMSVMVAEKFLSKEVDEELESQLIKEALEVVAND